MQLKVLRYGDPLLRRKSKRVPAITDEILKLVSDLIETMDASNGIGLAATQVGSEWALFVLRNYITDEEGRLHTSEPHVFINPEICFVSKETCIEEEGCLSVPGIRAQVERPVKLIIEATNLQGERFREELEGYNARVRMHENDHLNGVLYVDRVLRQERSRIEPLLRALKKQH